MNLEGNLKERPLTSVLQVLGTRTANGKLTVSRGTNAAEKLEVFFRSGLIVHTHSRLRSPDLRIGQLLVKGGYVAEDVLNAALERAEGTRGHVGDILVAQGKVDGVVLGDLLQLQMAEDLFDAVRWKEGSYQFSEGATQGRPSPAPPITPRDFLASSLKTLDRWEEIEHVVPDWSVAFERLIEGPIPEQEIVTHRLTPEDVKLFGLVHPSRTVAALVPLARKPSYELYGALVRLRKARLIERHYGKTFDAPLQVEEASTNAADGFTRVRVRKARQRSLPEAIAFHATTAAILIGVLALGLVVYLDGAAAGQDASASASGIVVATSDSDPVRDALIAYQLAKLRNAIQLHRVQRGEYPLRLDTLVEHGLLEASDLTYPDFERPYVYRAQGGTYVLIRPKK